MMSTGQAAAQALFNHSKGSSPTKLWRQFPPNQHPFTGYKVAEPHNSPVIFNKPWVWDTIAIRKNQIICACSGNGKIADLRQSEAFVFMPDVSNRKRCFCCEFSYDLCCFSC